MKKFLKLFKNTFAVKKKFHYIVIFRTLEIQLPGRYWRPTYLNWRQCFQSSLNLFLFYFDEKTGPINAYQ